MMTERPNVTRSGGSRSGPERLVEDAALQRIADDRHQRHDDEERDERIDAERSVVTSAT